MAKLYDKSNTGRFDMCKKYNKEGVNLTDSGWPNFVVSGIQDDSTCVKNIII